MLLEGMRLGGMGLYVVLKVATYSTLCGVAFKHIAKNCIGAMDHYGPYAEQWTNEHVFVKEITHCVQRWVICMSFIGFMIGEVMTYRKYAVIDPGLPNIFLKEKIVQLFPKR